MLTAKRYQRSIARDVEVRGVGFLTGADVSLRFRPAEADTGVVFVRTDLPDRPAVAAHIRHVVPRQRRTTLQHGAASVEMVEHVLAALAGLHIDNCTVEIDAPETPGCDGSSQAFVEGLSAAGVAELDRERETLVIDRPVSVREGQSVLTALPGDGDGLTLAYHLDYGRQTSIGAQSYFLDLSPESFRRELAPSRTFLLEAEADALRQAGIGSRTTEADLLIFGPDGVIGNRLRYPDECAGTRSSTWSATSRSCPGTSAATSSRTARATSSTPRWSAGCSGPSSAAVASARARAIRPWRSRRS